MSVLLSESMPRARQRHTCSQCGRQVDAGERYHRAVEAQDGQARSLATCTLCRQLQQDLAAVGVVDVNDLDTEILAELAAVDWTNPELSSPLWQARAAAFGARWPARIYPVQVRAA